MGELAEWDSFYVIVGSSAGALIGLQFVIMTLLAARPPADGLNTGAAFATPTVVHFSFTLFLSALMRVPWHSIEALRAIGLLGGAGGAAYMTIVAARMRRQRGYRPELEDWLFHLWLPLAAYLMLFVTGLLVVTLAAAVPFLFAGAALLLLLDAIHNAWDAVSYHVLWPSSPGDKTP